MPPGASPARAVLSAPGGPLRPASTVERYFSQHFGVGLAGGGGGEAGADVCVARHHNGVCVLCLSPRHPILSRGPGLCRVEFLARCRAVQGKRKRGGTFVQPATKICALHCPDGARFLVQSPIRGMLLELNHRLEQKPHLLTTRPVGEGYLAVILPRKDEIPEAVKNLLSKSEYDALFESQTHET